MSEGRKPHWRVIAKPEDDSRPGGVIGAAWENTLPDGRKFISVKLNVGVRVGWDDGLMIGLFSNDGYVPKSKDATDATKSPGESDLPF